MSITGTSATKHIRSVHFYSQIRENQLNSWFWSVGHFMYLLSHDLQSTVILNQWCFERKKNEQRLKQHGNKVVQIILAQHSRIRLVNSLLWAVYFAKGSWREGTCWAIVAMVSCVADPHESEAKCATNKRRESNWYLNETDNRKQARPSLANEKELHLLI